MGGAQTGKVPAEHGTGKTATLGDALHVNLLALLKEVCRQLGAGGQQVFWLHAEFGDLGNRLGI